MGFREDIDLSGFIDDYRPWFGGKSLVGVHYTGKDHDHDEFDSFEPIPEDVRAPSNWSLNDPWRVGDGPPEASSGRAMRDTRRRFSWDVNGYYRLLGVPWPYVHATKGTLAKAYIAVDGQSSHRKTYYLKQLLNPFIRAEYDAMPLGEQYLRDDYVQDDMKARAASEAGKRTAAGKFTLADDVMDEWGYKMVEGDLDTNPNRSKDDQAPENFTPTEWSFSYWLWRSSATVTDRLADWQSMLITALSEAHANINFAIGFLGKQPHPYVIGQADGHWIVFLNDRFDPTPDLAASAASALLHDMKHDVTTSTTGKTLTAF